MFVLIIRINISLIFFDTHFTFLVQIPKENEPHNLGQMSKSTCKLKNTFSHSRKFQKDIMKMFIVICEWQFILRNFLYYRKRSNIVLK